MEGKSLKEGEEYLTVSMSSAKALEMVLSAVAKNEKFISFALFKNDEHETNSSKPHYKGNGANCFINKKKGADVSEVEVQ